MRRRRESRTRQAGTGRCAAGRSGGGRCRAARRPSPGSPPADRHRPWADPSGPQVNQDGPAPVEFHGCRAVLCSARVGLGLRRRRVGVGRGGRRGFGQRSGVTWPRTARPGKGAGVRRRPGRDRIRAARTGGTRSGLGPGYRVGPVGPRRYGLRARRRRRDGVGVRVGHRVLQPGAAGRGAPAVRPAPGAGVDGRRRKVPAPDVSHGYPALARPLIRSGDRAHRWRPARRPRTRGRGWRRPAVPRGAGRGPVPWTPARAPRRRPRSAA